MDKELGRIWKAVVTSIFNVLFRHLPGETEENKIEGVLKEIRT
jgi:hypothetical protein